MITVRSDGMITRPDLDTIFWLILVTLSSNVRTSLWATSESPPHPTTPTGSRQPHQRYTTKRVRMTYVPKTWERGGKNMHQIEESFSFRIIRFYFPLILLKAQFHHATGQTSEITTLSRAITLWGELIKYHGSRMFPPQTSKPVTESLSS